MNGVQEITWVEMNKLEYFEPEIRDCWQVLVRFQGEEVPFIEVVHDEWFNALGLNLQGGGDDSERWTVYQNRHGEWECSVDEWVPTHFCIMSDPFN